MKILLVSSYLPYPLYSGGHIRLYNILKELSKNHQITLVCEKRAYQGDSEEKEVRKFCRQLITVEKKKQWSVGNILRTGFSFYPFLLTGHKNQEMKAKIKELLTKESFDLIHVETFYVMQNLPKVNLPIVLAEHNIEYLVYERFARQNLFLLRTFLSYDIAKLRFWEKHFWRKATKVIAVSENEKKIIEQEILKKVEVVPNGVDLNKFKVQNSKFKVDREEKTILFLGDFKWIKNRDAAKWLVKEIWPAIKSKIKNRKAKIKLWVVGSEITDSIKKLGKNEKNIVFDENAPSQTEEIYQQADLLIAPIRVGGGTSFKILEAMAMGVPVIATSYGIEGIDAKPNKEVLIGDNALEMAIKIQKILQDDDLYQRIAQNARTLIEKKYDWKTIVKKLELIYQGVLAN